MKVKVINSFNKAVIDKLFPLGNEFEIEPIYSTKEEVICNGSNETGSSKLQPIFPRVVRPKGSYIGFKIKAIDGHYYDGNYFIHWLGYHWGLSDYFQKLTN